MAKDWSKIQGVHKGWYLNAGYRIDNFTPYLMHERGPMQVAGAFPYAFEFDTSSAGMRWDLAKNVDVKVQYDYSKPRPGSNGGALINVQPQRIAGTPFHVISLAADFVF